MAAWGLFLAVLLLMTGRGLAGVVIGVRAELEGLSTTVTGVVVAAYFAGFLLGSQVALRIMRRVGHIRVFAAFSAVIMVSILSQGVWVAPVPWAILRFFMGFCLVGSVIVAESWLNDSVTNDNRGRVMAVYMVATMGGVATGQFMLSLGNPAEITLFIVSASAIALAIVPISLSTNSPPDFDTPPKMDLAGIWREAPLGVVAALATGMANASLLGLAAVYASQVGMPVSRTALFAGAAAVGAVILQWPIGYLSDYAGRRAMILVVSIAAMVIAVAAIGLPADGRLIIAAMFVFGGLSYTMYSLALSHVIDVLPTGMAVTASATNVFLAGIGSIVGPVVTSWLMTALGPAGFWWAAAGAFAVVALYAVYRLVRRPRIDDLSPAPYLAVPARSLGLLRLRRRVERKV